MVKLSVNINKLATLRNARGGNNPDILKAARLLQEWGADGITVHPRPDERHIRFQDVLDLRPLVHTEFNIEGYPDERYFQLIEAVRPEQATLVPDGPHQLTSNAGWDVVTHFDFLKETVARLLALGAGRVSIFVDPDPAQVRAAAQIGAQRIELYTEPYASHYLADREAAVAPYREAALTAQELGLGLNAGHDLDLDNLAWFATQVPGLLEVSIGHALVCDALYYGLENTVQMYKKQLVAS